MQTLHRVWGFPVGELFDVYISVLVILMTYHFNNIIIMYTVPSTIIGTP